MDIYHRTQLSRLAVAFLAWKALLLLLATFSPGAGYDTSGRILLADDEWSTRSQTLPLLDRLALKHLRWDALYFVKAAQRGYLYEQEWAFSLSYSTILSAVVKYVTGTEGGPLKYYVWAGICISGICHLISVLVLYQLARVVLGPRQSPKIPFIAAALHIISPAGLFMSAPYAESAFSAINFTGMLSYALARRTADTWTVTRDLYMLSAGVLFAFATLLRSNGLLSGLILLYDAVALVPRILTLNFDVHEARRLLVTCVAGGILALGFILPQVLAYWEYCDAAGDDALARPWCRNTVPSIYSWVQSHYWGVGFLRYWNISNLPLFLIAAPMLWLLSKTSVTVLQELRYPPVESPVVRSGQPASTATKPRFCKLPQLVIPQLVLAIAAATNFHVQIINRISSGYPLWYLVLAKWILDKEVAPSHTEQAVYARYVIRGMVVYAIIQGMLFAGFLPPA